MPLGTFVNKETFFGRIEHFQKQYKRKWFGYNGIIFSSLIVFDPHVTVQKKFLIKDFFSKCDQIPRKLRVWSHLLKKTLMVNFIFCAVSHLTTKMKRSQETVINHCFWIECGCIIKDCIIVWLCMYLTLCVPLIIFVTKIIRRKLLLQTQN